MVHFIDPPNRSGPGEYAITKIRQPMSNTAAASFYFVNASSNNGSPGDNEVTRIQIRRQAMSRAAAARKKGKAAVRSADKNDRHNAATPSTSLVSSATSARTPALAAQSSIIPYESSHMGMFNLHSVPRKMPCTGYEFMRMKQGFDIMDLSSFTAFHINRGAFRFLASKPTCIMDLMRHRQWSFLSYLPSRYGSSQCLDDACQAIGSRLQHWLKAPDNLLDATTVALHTKALLSLQSALAHPVQRLSADTLCATQILSLYELLNTSSDDAWSHHAAGTTSLIRLRGPHRYKTEFEKALLLAHAGPIFTQSFMNDDDFFLDEEEWRSVFKSAILEDRTCSFRSEISLSLWDIICHLPNYLKAVADVIGRGKVLGEGGREALIARGHHLRDSLLQWHKSHNGMLPEIGQLPKGPSVPGSVESQFEPLGLYINCSITVSRVVVALDPLKGAEIEKQVQALAVWFLALEREAKATDSRVGLFLTLKRHVPHSTLATRYLWKEVTRLDSNVTVATAFQEWIKGLGGNRQWDDWQDASRSKLIT